MTLALKISRDETSNMDKELPFVPAKPTEFELTWPYPTLGHSFLKPSFGVHRFRW